VSLHIDGVVYKEADKFLAHALQLDLVVSAQTEGRALKDLLDVCVTQIRYAFENNNFEHLFRPAPPEIWKKWGEADKWFTAFRVIEVSPQEKAKKRSAPRALSFNYVKAA
jgi:hypothetical protein